MVNKQALSDELTTLNLRIHAHREIRRLNTRVFDAAFGDKLAALEQQRRDMATKLADLLADEMAHALSLSGDVLYRDAHAAILRTLARLRSRQAASAAFERLKTGEEAAD